MYCSSGYRKQNPGAHPDSGLLPPDCPKCSKPVFYTESTEAPDAQGENRRWHRTCFVCDNCCKPLSPDKFQVYNNQRTGKVHWNKKLCADCHWKLDGKEWSNYIPPTCCQVKPSTNGLNHYCSYNCGGTRDKGGEGQGTQAECITRTAQVFERGEMAQAQSMNHAASKSDPFRNRLKEWLPPIPTQKIMRAHKLGHQGSMCSAGRGGGGEVDTRSFHSHHSGHLKMVGCPAPDCIHHPAPHRRSIGGNIFRQSTTTGGGLKGGAGMVPQINKSPERGGCIGGGQQIKPVDLIPARPACGQCNYPVYWNEKVFSVKKAWHKDCLYCANCLKKLSPGKHTLKDGRPICHFPCTSSHFSAYQYYLESKRSDP